MKLVEKIVCRATENTLLRVETISQLTSILGLVVGVLALFLNTKNDTKMWAIIFISLMLVALI